MLKESNKSRFDSYGVRKSVLIISHITFRDCRVHSFSDNLSRNSCMQANKVYCLIKVLMHITYCYRCSTLACVTGPLRSVHTWRQVAATRCSDTSQQQIASCVLENFCENLCLRNKSQKIKSDRICATCCCEKTLLQRQRFSPNFSCTHKAICRCDVSP